MKKTLLLLPLLLLTSCVNDRFKYYTHISSGDTERQVVINFKEETWVIDEVVTTLEMDFYDIYYDYTWFIVCGDGELHLRLDDISYWYIDD